MNTHITVYSPEEKAFFVDHFITKTPGHAQRYHAFIQDFYNTLSNDSDLTPHVPVITRRSKSMPTVRANNVGKIPFDTNHILWDIKSKDNLVTHFLAQPEFKITNGSLYQLNMPHPNWAHENNQGDTALILLAKRGAFYQFEKIIQDFNLDPNYKNKDDKYFTHFLFSTTFLDTIKEPDFHTFVKYLTIFQRIDNIMDVYPHHFLVSSNKLLQMIDLTKKSMQKITELYEITKDSTMTLQAFDMIKDKVYQVSHKLKNYQLLANLERNLPEKEQGSKHNIKI